MSVETFLCELSLGVLSSLLASHIPRAFTYCLKPRPHLAKFNKPVEVGAIIDNVWGYEQTNVDFYEVVKVSAHYVWLQPLKQTMTETGYMSGYTSPQLGSKHGETKKHGVSLYNGKPIINFQHGSGSVWDGKPARYSRYA